jgi:DNA-binding MarR family transcriptional regulator
LSEPQAPEGAVFFQLFNEIGIIAQLSRAMLDQVMPGDLIAPHFAVLNHLVRVADGRTPLDLARAFQVPKTSMTHTLAGLEGAGLIAMRPNPSDGRSKQVWITEAGRALRGQVIAAMAPSFARLAQDFAPDRALSLLPDLTALRRWLDADRDPAQKSGV